MACPRPLRLKESDTGDHKGSSLHIFLSVTKNMSKKHKNEHEEMQPEYNFTSGVRGKYVNRLMKGKSVIILEPDVAKIFPDSESVNQALRALLPIIQRQTKEDGQLKKN